MTNAFGGFLHISPPSSLTSSTSRPADPRATLSSNCVRDYFGPVVQSVADALHARGPSTLQELVANVRHHCLRDWNQERGRLVDRLNGAIDRRPNRESKNEELLYRGSKVNMNKARGSELAGFVTDASHIRAALIVLIHHSLVKVSGGGVGGQCQGGKDPVGNTRNRPDPSQQKHYTYTFLHERARLLPRYPRYVEHAQNIMDESAANIVEALLISGRMRGEDVISGAWVSMKSKLKADDDSDDENSNEDDDGSDSNEILKNIVHSFLRLVEEGFVKMVQPIITNQGLDGAQNKEIQDGIHGGEVEFAVDKDGTIAVDKKSRQSFPHSLECRSAKKQRVCFSSDAGDMADNHEHDRDDSYGSSKPHHPRILVLLKPHRKIVPFGSVYCVNPPMFHASLRAMVLSRLVSEMYPVESDKNTKKNDSTSGENTKRHLGYVVNAALAFAARQEHAPLECIKGVEESEEDRHRRMAEWGTFSPPDIVPYLPHEVTEVLKSQVGGLNQNLSSLLVRMSELGSPPILFEVEEAIGHPRGGKFEVCTRQLLQRVRDRILHRVLTAHHGLVAARIVSILQMRGHSESEAVAEDAMVPAKEAREILHRLHRDGYINLFDMHMTKTHNTATAIFLWDVVPSRLIFTVVDNMCMAMLNLRLRRQHEVEVGKEWMDRAKEGGETEENVHEDDKMKYLAFCKGLERLDCACLQLDETLMVLKDF